MLSQVNIAGEENTVALASRSLSDAERKYSIVEKGLACVWAAEKLRVWLWGRNFLLRTDHQVLMTLRFLSNILKRNATIALPFPNLRTQIQKPWPGKKAAVELTLQPYYMVHDELSVVEDCVFRGAYRLVVPVSLQKHLIEIAHETHQGIVRTKQWLRKLYWWPGMDRQVEALIEVCATCKQNYKMAVTHNAPLQPVPLPAWEIVGPFDIAPGLQTL